MIYKIFSVIMAVCMAVASLFGITLKQKGLVLNMNRLDKNITASQNKRLKDGKITGAHIIVNQNGESVFDKRFGKSSVNSGEDLKDDAMYRIASMTKPVTAVALLIEHERGNLNIYDDVSKYLEGYDEMYVKKDNSDGTVKLERAKNCIKLYMLVSHISGIDESKWDDIPEEQLTHKGIAEFYKDKPLVFDPATSQSYNTVAYDIAARVIEITSGMPFDEYLKANIFDKLGMNDTTFEPDDEQWDRMVVIHGMQNGVAYDAPSPKGYVIGNHPQSYHGAGCALASTAYDYSKFAEMLLNGGKAEDGTAVIGEETLKLMSTPVVSKDIMPGDEQWGLGVRVITSDKNTLPKGSFGWSGALGSHFWVDPTNKITAIYMKNSKYDGGAGNMTAVEFEKDLMKSFSLKTID